MELILRDTSIVVLAASHNPTILHPSFLVSEQIVPANWEIKEDPICTPPVSIVKYVNGVTFIAETNRLQIVQSVESKKIIDSVSSTSDDFPSDIQSLATRYVNTLPHVRYTAVGTNITSMLECADPGKYMLNRFVTPGSWNNGDNTIDDLSLQFVYSLGSTMLKWTIKPSQLSASAPDSPHGIMVHGNYHTELIEPDKRQTVDDAKLNILKYPDHCDHYLITATRIFGAEE